MNKAVGIYAPGLQTFKDNDGKTVEYDNVFLSYVTDEIPENLIGAYNGVRAQEEKFTRSSVKLIGLNDWSEIVGHEFEFGYSKNLKGQIKINKVFVQDT